MSQTTAESAEPTISLPQGQQRHEKTRQHLSRLSFNVHLILLAAALIAGILLVTVVPGISYFIAATLATMATLAVGFILNARQQSVIINGAVALMHVAWIAFALYFTGALNSPLLPLLYVIAVIYAIQRDTSQTGLVLGGALIALLVQLFAMGTLNNSILLTVAGHAVLLTTASWAISNYVEQLYQVEETATSNAAKYQLMTDSSKDALLVVDPAWNVVELNAAAADMLRNGQETNVIGKSLPDLLHLSNSDALQSYQEQALSGKIVSQLPLTVTDQDEQQHAMLFSALPISEDGQITSIQVALRDITQLKEFRQEIKHLEKFAAVRHVLTGVGHSLNNPLAIIQLSAQIAQTMGHQLDYEEILRQIGRCTKAIRGLEIYSAGHHPSIFVTDLNQILTQALLLTNSQLMMTSVECRLDVPPNLPLVRANPHSLQRSFINIITNAWEAMEDWPGPCKLTIDARRLIDGVQISFRDTGPGVTAEEIPNLFKTSYTTKEDQYGMGLGLPVVYDTVQQAGGQVIVSPNRREGGTLVKIILPLAKEEQIKQYKALIRTGGNS